MRLPERLGALRRLRRAPWPILLVLVAAHWTAIGIFASVVRRNSWLFYQGGDETFFWTTSWALGSGHIPEARIGWVFSYLLVPFAWIFGQNLLSALPAVILFQVVVLGPIAIFAVYGVGARIGGRVIGYLAAALWVLGPYAAIPLWRHDYHAKYVEQYLPQALGLTGLGDYASAVALVVSAYFCLRALDTEELGAALLGGLAAGLAIGIKPSSALFLGAPLVAFVLARRFRPGLGFAAGFAPLLLALALWKLRGLGHLPVQNATPGRYLAAGSGGDTLPVAAVNVSKYLHLNWAQWHNNLANIREFFWSPRMLEWFPIAGALAVARRSFAKAAFLVAWFGAFVLVRMTSPASSIEGGTFLRLFLPAMPAFVLLCASIPLLVPTWGGKLAGARPPGVHRLAWSSGRVLAPVAVLALLPALLFVVLPTMHAGAARITSSNVYVPIDKTWKPHLDSRDFGSAISWRIPAHRNVNVFFQVLRVPVETTIGKGSENLPVRKGILVQPLAHGASEYTVEMEPLGTTRDRFYVDHTPKGRWAYRVAMMANWRNDVKGGDILLLSEPLVVTGPT